MYKQDLVRFLGPFLGDSHQSMLANILSTLEITLEKKTGYSTSKEIIQNIQAVKKHQIFEADHSTNHDESQDTDYKYN